MPAPVINIFTDATKTGWGITDGQNPSEGQWKEYERMHIIVLERKAAFVRIRIKPSYRSYNHIRVMSDSSAAIACINNKADIKFNKCNEIAKEIWLCCFKNNSFISLAQMPGKHNIETDRFSRKFNNNTESQLNPKIFIEITNIFVYPEIDLFATRINIQLQNYVS